MNETAGTTGHETVSGNDVTFFNSPEWFDTYSINSSQYNIQYDTDKADIQVRVGDIDNFGFGFPSTYDPFSGDDTPAIHGFPFYPSSDDTDGTDRIMVPSSFDYNHPVNCQNGSVCVDGYTNTTQGTDNAVRPIVIPYDLKGKTINNAEIQLFIDDIQAADPIVKSHFTFTLNGVEIPTASQKINVLNQTGPKGKLITINIPQAYLYLLNSGTAQIKIDDTTTGIGDGYAIDFAQLLINPKNAEAIDPSIQAPSYGVKLNGVSQFGQANVNINPNNENVNMKTMTIEGWMKPNQTGNWQVIFSNSDNNSCSRAFGISPDNRFAVCVNGTIWYPNLPVDFNQWQHVSVTYSPDHITFYKNGKKDEYDTLVTEENAQDTINIGRNPSAEGSAYFNGDIADIRIWNKELTSSELNQSLTGNEQGLIAWWKLDETRGNIGKDSLSQHDLIFNNYFLFLNDLSLKPYSLEYNTSEADIVARTGDVDNFGSGFPDGYDPFSGEEPSSNHSYPSNTSDPIGTDTIMVPSSYDYNNFYCDSNCTYKDGYTTNTTRPDNEIKPITITYDLNGIPVNSAEFQLYVDNFKPDEKDVGSKFTVTINNREIPELEDIINNLNQTDYKGKLIKFVFPDKYLDLLQDGQISIKIDDTTTGAGDGYAIDFARLLINPKNVQNIVFIPGIAGTELDNKNTGYKYWAPESSDFLNIDHMLSPLELNDDGTSINTNVKNGEPLENYYGKIISEMRSKGYNVYTFGYDWRLNNTDTAKKLEKFVSDNKLDHFTIVAHSMGGLISAYYMENPDNKEKVDKFISIGTPYLGAPKALWVLETGKLTGDSIKDLAIGSYVKQISDRSYSSYQLLPSPFYFNNGNSSYISVTHDANFQNIYNYKDSMNAILSRNYINNTDLNNLLNEATNFHDNLNLEQLLNEDKSYVIYGNHLDTINSIALYDGIDLQDIVDYTDGDGTVPTKSATLNGEILNGHLYSVSEEHSELCNNPTVIDDVLNILEDKSILQPRVLLASTATSNTVHPWIKIHVQNTKPEEIKLSNEINPSDYDLYSFGNDTIINTSLTTIQFQIDKTENDKTNFNIEEMGKNNNKINEYNFNDVDTSQQKQVVIVNNNGVDLLTK